MHSNFKHLPNKKKFAKKNAETQWDWVVRRGPRPWLLSKRSELLGVAEHSVALPKFIVLCMVQEKVIIQIFSTIFWNEPITLFTNNVSSLKKKKKFIILTFSLPNYLSQNPKTLNSAIFNRWPFSPTCSRRQTFPF